MKCRIELPNLNVCDNAGNSPYSGLHEYAYQKVLRAVQKKKNLKVSYFSYLCSKYTLCVLV